MNVATVLGELTHATAGDKLVYHVGFLANDAEISLDARARRAIAWQVGAPTQSRWGGEFQGFGAAYATQEKTLGPRRGGLGIYEYSLRMKRALSVSEIGILRRLIDRALMLALPIAA